MLADRHTNRQTDRHAHHSTPLPYRGDRGERDGSNCAVIVTESERKCADTIGTVQLTWAGHFQSQNTKFFKNRLKYTEAIVSNSTRKLLWFEMTKVLIAVLENKLIVLFVIIFGTLSFPSGCLQCFDTVGWAAGMASGL